MIHTAWCLHHHVWWQGGCMEVDEKCWGSVTYSFCLHSYAPTFIIDTKAVRVSRSAFEWGIMSKDHINTFNVSAQLFNHTARRRFKKCWQKQMRWISRWCHPGHTMKYSLLPGFWDMNMLWPWCMTATKATIFSHQKSFIPTASPSTKTLWEYLSNLSNDNI